MSLEPKPQDQAQTAQCPQCQSRFRLTAQHLEAAKGWVQCGVCGHVFFSGLTPPPKPKEIPQSALPAEPAPSQVAESASTRHIADPATLVEPVEKTTPVSPMPSGLANRIAEDENPTTLTFGPKLESIILVDPNAAHDDHDPGPLPVIEPQPEPGRATGHGSSVPPPPSRIGNSASTNWVPRQPASSANKAPQKGRSLAWLWWLLSILLILVLLSQTIWFMRDSLAAQHPALRPVLQKMCGVLDCTLGLPRNASQVVVLGSDLQTEDDGRLVLTLNLANKAATNMAWPVLELTLTDVEDQPLARRVFAPSEYLNSPKLEAEGIAQLSEVPIALTMQSKDVKAAGYRLRMFY